MRKLYLITFASEKQRGSISDRHKELLDLLKTQYEVNLVNIRNVDQIPKDELKLIFITSRYIEQQIVNHYESLPHPLLLLTDGYNNSLAAVMEIKAWANSQSIKAKLLYSEDESIINRIDTIYKVHSALCRLRGRKIGVVGTPCPWLISSSVNYLLAQRRWGIEYVDLPVEEVLAEYANVTDDEVGEMAAEIAGNARTCIEATPDDLLNDMRAYKALRRVIRANPTYELSFSAQILQTEVMAEGNHSKVVKKLKRMARNRKNKDYQDQIYYALGNIYLANNDTAHCIGAYEKGAKESTQNGIAKAMLLLRLGGIYWDKKDYINAQRCYAELVGILDKEHEDYKEVERRSAALTEVEPHLSAIKLQDSLQWLAKLPEAERNKAIDYVIEELKKKEKEEARKITDAEMAARMPTGTTPTAVNPAGNRATAGGQQGQSGVWYFYNPSVVAQGKRQFARTWGRRPLEDNWRRSHKNEDRTNGFEEYDYSEAGDSLMAAQADSIARADSIAEVEARMADSLASDPHQREYYLQQIPFTEEQLQASNDILRDALYQAGILEMERLEDFVLARQTLLRLIDSFPDVADKDNVYYHLFLICGRLGDLAGADLYKQKLLEEFPDSPYAIMLANPRYELYARQGKHIEDSLYAATYEAYGRDDYEEVFRNYATSTTDFPEGAHRAKFMFVQAMSQLYSGQRDSFLVTLKQVIEKYPKDEVTEMAQSIVKGIEEGRSLSDGKYAASDIWSRRTAAAQQDSTAEAQQLSDERLCNFVFLLAYPENSLDEDQLLYEMALYNFTSFMVRNFDIQIEKAGGIAQMRVSGFLNFDEVHAYAQKLYADPHMSVLLKNIRSVIISEDNLKLLGTLFSFDDYKKFYDEKFAPLKVPEDFRLDEPTSIEIRDPDDMPPADDEEYEDDDDGYNNTDSGIIF